MSKQKIDYAKSIKQALNDAKEEIFVTVNGVEFPVTQPSGLEFAKVMSELDKSGANEVEIAVATVKLCLPAGLDDSDVFDLIMAGDYLKDDSELRKAVDTQCKAIFDAFNVGNSEEGDADFGEPGRSASA